VRAGQPPGFSGDGWGQFYRGAGEAEACAVAGSEDACGASSPGDFFEGGTGYSWD